MTQLVDKAADRGELMTINVQTVHTSWVTALSVPRTLKQPIICFQGQTVLESIKGFLKVSVLVLVGETCRI